MSMLDVMQARYSVRHYDEQRPVEAEKLAAVLEAGRLAPTAVNGQPQRLFVVKSPEALGKLRAFTRCAFNAPVVVVLAGETSEAWVSPFNGRNSCEMDVSIVATHMMLEAQAQGLGSLWVCYADLARVKEALKLPESVTLYGLLDLGYPAEDAAPSEQHGSRKPLEETVSFL